MLKTNRIWLCLSGLAVALCAGCATPPPALSPADTVAQVRDAEIAFAKSMADRDFQPVCNCPK